MKNQINKTPAQPLLPVQYPTKIEILKRLLEQKMQMSLGTFVGFDFSSTSR